MDSSCLSRCYMVDLLVELPLDGLNDDSNIGNVYEVDISYLKHLHDVHNELPFLPNNSVPPSAKVKKLMATLEPKKNYIIYYRNLKQAKTSPKQTG